MKEGFATCNMSGPDEISRTQGEGGDSLHNYRAKYNNAHYLER